MHPYRPEAADSLDLAREVDSLCDRFEAAWQRGEHPELDAWLPAEGPLRRAALPELARLDQEYRRKECEDKTPVAAAGPEALAPLPETLAMPAPDADPQATRQTLSEQKAPPSSEKAAWPLIPGYEVFGVLGQGGMGVVYQARQFSLKRVIALKMVLAGAHATSEHLARFRTEAEAVAHLQHPNIVQIYEIGEHGGLPYFSLEFVGGGSLSKKLADKPLPPEEAARLVETLARAMQHAHQRGVVHRDLKPANVLLTEEGTPKITDFGLAKRLEENEPGQTRSGSVMGTPSYMAPEQAEGRKDQVGPLSDVYALGAILYEALTGRPPFRAETVMQTLHQVLTQEVVPPSRLVPKIERDLETICLKALSKDPKGRYASALALAQDLERFLAGEPILARRDGLTRKAVRVLRRRWPLVITGMVIATALTTALVAYFGGREARRAAELGQQLQAAFTTEPAAWSGALVEEQEARIAELAKLAPEQADGWHAQLGPKFRGAILAQIQAPRLGTADRDRIEILIGAFALRWPDGGHDLQERLRQRSSEWQEVLALTAPFTGWETAIAAADARTDRDGLLSQVTRDPPVTQTAVRCEGNAEIEARWDESWIKGRTVGVVLHAGSAATYSFLLSSTSVNRAQAEAPDVPDRVLGDTLRAGGSLYLQIWRGDQCLSETAVVSSVGPLMLRARRQAGQLECQVGALEPVRFTDALPLPVGGGYGLHWPAGVRLVSMRCRRQVSPTAPSLLESTDALLAQRRFGDALAEYEKPEFAGGTVGAEARYKAAVCLLELQRFDEAAERLERVAAEEGDRWPLLAAYRLWLLRLQQNQVDKAEDVFHSLLVRSRPESVIQYVPAKLRADLLDRQAGAYATAMTFLKPNAATCERLARTLKGYKLLQVDAGLTAALHVTLFRLRWAAGQPDQALAEAETWLAHCEQQDPLIRLRSALSVRLLADWAWLHQIRGGAQTRTALERVERWIAPLQGRDPSELPIPFIGCLMSRARLRGALGDWQGAEHDVAECERMLAVRTSGGGYGYWADVHFLKGFLHERKGEAQAKLIAWKKGTLRVYRETTNRQSATGSSVPTFQNWFMSVAAGSLDDADAAELMSQFAGTAGDRTFVQVAKTANVNLSVLRRTMQMPRGAELTRKFAFGQESLPDFVRGRPQLLGLALIREGAFTDDLFPEQDELIWRLAADLMDLYAADKLGHAQILQLGLTWKGVGGPLTWGAVSPKLSPQVRGSLAYVFGHRFLRLKKPKEAAAFFRTALADAPAGSPLQRLAQAALDRRKNP